MHTSLLMPLTGALVTLGSLTKTFDSIGLSTVNMVAEEYLAEKWLEKPSRKKSALVVRRDEAFGAQRDA